MLMACLRYYHYYFNTHFINLFKQTIHKMWIVFIDNYLNMRLINLSFLGLEGKYFAETSSLRDLTKTGL